MDLIPASKVRPLAMTELKTCTKLAVQLLLQNDTVTGENKIAKKCLHYRIDSAMLYVDIMYAAYCIKSLEQVTSKCNASSVTALPMLEGSLGRVVPGFDCGYLLKHWQTMAKSCLERTTTPCLLQLVS